MCESTRAQCKTFKFVRYRVRHNRDDVDVNVTRASQARNQVLVIRSTLSVESERESRHSFWRWMGEIKESKKHDALLGVVGLIARLVLMANKILRLSLSLSHSEAC